MPVMPRRVPHRSLQRFRSWILIGALTGIVGRSLAWGEDSTESSRGLLGQTPLSREAEGTAWQPDSMSHDGIDRSLGSWRLSVDGRAFATYSWQGSVRRADKIFSTNELGVVVQRPFTHGSLAVRSRASLEPLMGSYGYPMLFQTGETGDGRTPLVDRQAPHNLISELAAIASVSPTEKTALFTYWALPGEPAIGPGSFSEANPEMPLSHHWLNSTHQSYGVGTLGLIWDKTKWEASAFRGREPDQNHWDMEKAKLDSWSARLTLNPNAQWSGQISFARLNDPEQLSPGQDFERVTASVMRATRYSADRLHYWLLTWGRNWPQGVPHTDAWVGESTWEIQNRHTFFGRAERLENDHLVVAGSPLANPSGFSAFRHGPFTDPGGVIVPVRIFTLYKVSFGYIYDLVSGMYGTCGVGAMANIHFLPRELDRYYGDTPASFLIFLRLKLGESSSSENLERTVLTPRV